MAHATSNRQLMPPESGILVLDDDLIDYSDHEEDYISPAKRHFDGPFAEAATDNTELDTMTSRATEPTIATEIASPPVNKDSDLVQAEVAAPVDKDFDLVQEEIAAPVNKDSDLVQATEPAEDLVRSDAIRVSTEDAIPTRSIASVTNQAVLNITDDVPSDSVEVEVGFKIDYDDFADGNDSGDIVDDDEKYNDGTLDSIPAGAITTIPSGTTDDRSLHEWNADPRNPEIQAEVPVLHVIDVSDAVDANFDTPLQHEPLEGDHNGGDLLVDDSISIGAPEDEITYDEHDDQAQDDTLYEDIQQVESEAEILDIQQSVASAVEQVYDYDDPDTREPVSYDAVDVAEPVEAKNDVMYKSSLDGNNTDLANALGKDLVTVDDDEIFAPRAEGTTLSILEGDEPLDDAPDSIMQSAHVNYDSANLDDNEGGDDEAAWPSVTVSYKGDEYPMFSSSDRLGFFSDISVLESSMHSLLAAFRAELSEELRSDEDLVFQIDELGLEYSESTVKEQLEKVTLQQVINLHSRLIVNQSGDPSRGPYAFLFTRPNSSVRLKFLFESAEAGKGLDSVAHYLQPPRVAELTGAAMGLQQADSNGEGSDGEEPDGEDSAGEEHDYDEADEAFSENGLGHFAEQNGITADNESRNHRTSLMRESDNYEVNASEIEDGQGPSEKDDGEHVAPFDHGVVAAGGATEMVVTDIEEHNDLSTAVEYDQEEYEQDLDGDEANEAEADGQVNTFALEEDEPGNGAAADATLDHQQDEAEEAAQHNIINDDDDEQQQHDPADWPPEMSTMIDDGDQQPDFLTDDANAAQQAASVPSSASSTIDGEVAELDLDGAHGPSNFEFDENEIDWREDGDFADDISPEETTSPTPSGTTKRSREDDEGWDLEHGQDAKRRRPCCQQEA